MAGTRVAEGSDLRFDLVDWDAAHGGLDDECVGDAAAKGAEQEFDWAGPKIEAAGRGRYQ